MPSSRRVHIGCWEGGAFIGALVFSRGACRHIGRPFGLEQIQVAELARIALRRGHVTPTSRILTIACRLVYRQSPGLAAIVSYSDPAHGHTGRGVYAAAGWVYLGEGNVETSLVIHGHMHHARSVFSKYGSRSARWVQTHIDPQATAVRTPAKHKWALGLTADMRARLAEQAQPYPTRPNQQAPANPAGLDGATPIRPLLHHHIAEHRDA